MVGGVHKFVYGVVQCEHAVLHDMVDASSSTGIPIAEAPEEREGEIGVDSAFHSIPTSCCDAHNFVATREDMGRVLVASEMLFYEKSFPMARLATVHYAAQPVRTRAAGA